MRRSPRKRYDENLYAAETGSEINVNADLPEWANRPGIWRGTYGPYVLEAHLQDHKDPRSIHTVCARFDSQPVGYVCFDNYGHSLIAKDLSVSKEHRRHGVASAMYRHAEQVSGIPAEPSDDQTRLGRKFWSARRWRRDES